MKSAKRHLTLATLALAVVVPSIILASSASEPECEAPLKPYLNKCVDPVLICDELPETDLPSFCENLE